jgi:signal transduction histidine kinase
MIINLLLHSFYRCILISFKIYTFFIIFVYNTTYAQYSYNHLKLKTQNLSYFDSIGVFETGKLAIEQAKIENKPELEAEILIYFGNHYYYRSLYEKAAQQYQLALNKSIEHKNNHFANLARIRLAYILAEKGSKIKAYDIFKTILTESRKNNDYIIQIEALNALALHEEHSFNSTQSAAYYLEALKIAESNNDDYYTALILNNLGLIKLGAKKYSESLADFQRAYELSVKINNPRLSAHLSNNIALIYMEQNKFKEALIQHKNNLNFAKITGNIKELYVAYINLSSVLMQLDDLKNAVKYCDSAIFYMKKSNHYNELGKGYLGKAQILFKLGEYNLSHNNLDTALIISDSLKHLENQVGIHLFYSKIYEKQGRLSEALNEYKLYKQLNDSLDETRNSQFLSEIQVQYQVEKQQTELENERQQRLNEKRLSQTKMYFTIVGSLALILLTAALIYIRYNRQRRIQQQKFSQQLIHSIEEERSRIAKDLHDDIGQSLSAIKSKVRLLNTNNNEALTELENDTGKIIEQTREISRKLYPSYLEKIGLTRSIAQLMEKIQKHTHIVCSFEIHSEVENLDITTKTHLYRITQECINNTIKHAEASALKLIIEKKDNEFIFTYRDNGKGIKKIKTEQIEGIGFMAIKERASILNGELNLGENFTGGFKLMLNFKA